jgi:hypothetical protein
MQEDFLHYIWQYKKFDFKHLQTTSGQVLSLVHVGQHNLHSGPDFFNAQIRIDEQLWAGNVEIHLKSSDWYVHNHELDKAYDNVILHVVWEHDTDVFRHDNSSIPTLELKNIVQKQALNQYQKLFSNSHKWINCEHEIDTVDSFVINNWIERLFLERLEQKSAIIEAELKASNNNWEAVLFVMLAKNFGLKVNGDAFKSIAKSIDFAIVRKTQSDLLTLEALIFGQAGLLKNDEEDAYFKSLKKEYGYLKHKFNLNNLSVLPLQFFRLRPPNFPTIRLSQLASLYHQHQNLFSKVITINSKEAAYELFKISTSEFWQSHYTFSKSSRKSNKLLTRSFIDLLIINTIVPLQFCYQKQMGKLDEDAIFKLISEVDVEKNSVVNKFLELKNFGDSALHSQALLQLKPNYCDANRCLQCAIGNQVLKG